jgi:hypothetical protein
MPRLSSTAGHKHTIECAKQTATGYYCTVTGYALHPPVPGEIKVEPRILIRGKSVLLDGREVGEIIGSRSVGRSWAYGAFNVTILGAPATTPWEERLVYPRTPRDVGPWCYFEDLVKELRRNPEDLIQALVRLGVLLGSHSDIFDDPPGPLQVTLTVPHRYFRLQNRRAATDAEGLLHMEGIACESVSGGYEGIVVQERDVPLAIELLQSQQIPFQPIDESPPPSRMHGRPVVYERYMQPLAPDAGSSKGGRRFDTANEPERHEVHTFRCLQPGVCSPVSRRLAGGWSLGSLKFAGLGRVTLSMAQAHAAAGQRHHVWRVTAEFGSPTGRPLHNERCEVCGNTRQTMGFEKSWGGRRRSKTYIVRR